MNINQFLSDLIKCSKVSKMRSWGFILALVTLAFLSDNLYAQHLFSVSYGDLSHESARQMKERAASPNVSIATLTRSMEGEYTISLSTAQNTNIIILNEQTGNNVVITPTKEAPAEFRLQPFFIEELRRSALGDADSYLMIEAGADFSVRSAAYSKKIYFCPIDNIFLEKL